MKTLLLLGLMMEMVGHAATINLVAPSFTGCQDRVVCTYSGYNGIFDSKVGVVEIGTMVFANHPSPAPDQHDLYQFTFNVNGQVNYALLNYRAFTTEVLFRFIFNGSPVQDPRIGFDMFMLHGPVDGVTAIPVVLEVVDITPNPTPTPTLTSASIHMPEPSNGLIGLVGLGLISIGKFIKQTQLQR